jgi:hypothetical protein
VNESKRQYYLLLGCAGSGRREVLSDLIESGFDQSGGVVVMLSKGEVPSASEASLPAIGRWEWRGDAISASLVPDSRQVIFVTDGRLNPVEQIEAFTRWMAEQGGELARVLCVVDCQFAANNPPLFAWFEACIHFSDVVLLNRREGVDNKWLSDFVGHFKKQFFPCLFEHVKDGRVRNPALVLEPEARRVSHVFDAEQDWIFTNADGEVIDEQEESEEGDGEEEVEATPQVDPYFARDAAGRRAKRLPDISKFLPPAPTSG